LHVDGAFGGGKRHREAGGYDARRLANGKTRCAPECADAPDD
jgi:hypothetical protein